MYNRIASEKPLDGTRFSQTSSFLPWITKRMADNFTNQEMADMHVAVVLSTTEILVV